MSRIRGARGRLAATAIVPGLLVAGVTHAALSPYLPLQRDPVMDRQVERLFVLAGRPLLTRPVTAAAVAEALEIACPRDEALCRSVSSYLARYTQSFALPEVALSGGFNDGDARVTLPNRHGLAGDAQWQASAGMHWQPGAGVVLAAGAIADDDKVVPAGSLLSVGWERAQLDIGWRDRWFSPMTDSAMLVSTEARAMPSVTLSNAVPLTRFKLRYEVFAARMSASERIQYRDGLTAGHPRLAGVHVSGELAPGVAFAANRVMQFGGGARGGSSPLDVLRAFFNPSRYDNTYDPVNEYQFGNQAVSVSSRFLFPGRVPFAAYAEYGGEDTSAHTNLMLGNAALSLGLDFPRLGEHFDLTAEVSEWQNGWYVHNVYQDGLANSGRVLGHWGANQRLAGHGVGARSAMLRLGWWLDDSRSLELRLRAIDNERYWATSPPYVTGRDIGLRYNHQAGPWSLGLELGAGRDVFGEDSSRALAFVRYAPGMARLIRAPQAQEARPQREPGAELFVDAGIQVASVRVDLDGLDLPAARHTTGLTPHLGLGARRRVSARQDLGVRIEHGEVDGHGFTSVRALDYRFRFARRLAFTGFVGAARYDLATPSYGQYVGAGLQWRDPWPGVDASLELRHAIRMARDEPTRGDGTDSFHDITALTLALSYRF